MRTTVFRRDEEATYVLKSQKGRQFLGEVKKRFPEMAFSLRSFEDATVKFVMVIPFGFRHLFVFFQMARIGVTECKRHELLRDYPVTREKDAFIAQFKYTVLCLPGGSKKITGAKFTQSPLLKTSKKIENADVRSDTDRDILL